MPRYAVRSTVIEAFQWNGSVPDIPVWVFDETREGVYLFVDDEGRLCRHYTENWLDKLGTEDEDDENFKTNVTTIDIGDYIIRTPDNAIFPCVKEFFEEKYFPLLNLNPEAVKR